MLLFSGCGVAGLGAASWFLDWIPSPKLAELLLQFALTGVLGAIVAFYLRHLEAARQQQKHEADAAERKQNAALENLQKFRDTVIAAYHDTKKIRRTLKSRAVMADESTLLIEKADFVMLMDRLEENQLKMEFLREVVASAPAFYGTPQQAALLEQDLRMAESYLREVLRQHERFASRKLDDEPSRHVTLDPQILEFIGAREAFARQISSAPGTGLTRRRADHDAAMRRVRETITAVIGDRLSLPA